MFQCALSCFIYSSSSFSHLFYAYMPLRFDVQSFVTKAEGGRLTGEGFVWRVRGGWAFATTPATVPTQY
jgi:hypothetical protein